LGVFEFLFFYLFVFKALHGGAKFLQRTAYSLFKSMVKYGKAEKVRK